MAGTSLSSMTFEKYRYKSQLQITILSNTKHE